MTDASRISRPSATLIQHDSTEDLLQDIPPEKQTLHIIRQLARQRERTEEALREVTRHIKETGIRLGGVESALEKIADLERKYHIIVEEMRKEGLRSEKTFERIGATLDKTSERLIGIETALVGLNRLEDVEKEIREVDKKVNALEVKSAQQVGEASVNSKLIWQILLWGGGFLFLLANLAFSLLGKK
jgi:chromosome segregation ATPase